MNSGLYECVFYEAMIKIGSPARFSVHGGESVYGAASVLAYFGMLLGIYTGCTKMLFYWAAANLEPMR
jgi:hypothetical protein